MPTPKELKDQYRLLALKAHEVVEADKSAAEVREELDKIEPELKSLSDLIKDADYLEEKRKSYTGIVDSGGADTSEEAEAEQLAAKSIGEMVTDSAEFKSAVENLHKGKTFAEAVNVKATLTESGLGNASVIAQDRQPGILPILFQRLTIADLMPSGATNSNVVRYIKESTATNAASTVAEEGLKPSAALNFDIVDEPVRKIAVILKVSDEMLEDFAQMQSYVNGRLTLFVRIEEEAQLLKGNTSTGANDLVGLLNRSGLTAAQPVGSETNGKIAIAIHKEITKVRVASFLDPTGIVFHPNDWEQARLEADANAQFFGGGPFTGPYGNGGINGDTYWGLPVVNTQAMTENTVLLGAFATAAQIFRRTGLTVEMTNSNEDDFKYNRVTVRAEERLALACYRPSAFGTVTGI